MAISKAQQKAVNKYVREKYDKLLLTMPKGRKDIIKAHAESQGESVNSFINRAIDNQMERDKDWLAKKCMTYFHIFLASMDTYPRKN